MPKLTPHQIREAIKRRIIGIRHNLMLHGIDADMREFGQLGIRNHERELLAANRDEVESLLTTLKLRGDREAQKTAACLQWLLVNIETRERRGSLFRV